MSNAKHAPGPWSVMSEWPEELDGFKHHWVVGADKEPLTDYPAQEEDIVLMAAAPDLLAALEETLTAGINWYETATKSDASELGFVVRARATIAKAKGES